MSERKVLQKYYPPDFDPAAITRTRAPKPAGPKVQTVRLMAPFSMKCTACGEYIYKGRKFNARKETTDEKYYSIAIFRFYIRCTRCSGEITFKTDPKNMDYECERGAKRNFEPWRQAGEGKEETEEERLDRLEEEERERDAMGVLEGKMVDAKREMAIADALDEIRTRNARIERVGKGEVEVVERDLDKEKQLERERVEKEIEEAARRAFSTEEGEKVRRIVDGEEDEDLTSAKFGNEESKSKDASLMPPPTFKRGVKRKKDFGAALGIKKKTALV
jgi:hypothetical protein